MKKKEEQSIIIGSFKQKNETCLSPRKCAWKVRRPSIVGLLLLIFWFAAQLSQFLLFLNSSSFKDFYPWIIINGFGLSLTTLVYVLLKKIDIGSNVLLVGDLWIDLVDQLKKHGLGHVIEWKDNEAVESEFRKKLLDYGRLVVLFQDEGRDPEKIEQVRKKFKDLYDLAHRLNIRVGEYEYFFRRI